MSTSGGQPHGSCDEGRKPNSLATLSVLRRLIQNEATGFLIERLVGALWPLNAGCRLGRNTRRSRRCASSTPRTLMGHGGKGWKLTTPWPAVNLRAQGELILFLNGRYSVKIYTLKLPRAQDVMCCMQISYFLPFNTYLVSRTSHLF